MEKYLEVYSNNHTLEPIFCDTALNIMYYDFTCTHVAGIYIVNNKHFLMRNVRLLGKEIWSDV